MSLATALLLAAAVSSQAATADQPRVPDRGAQVDSARISVTILRPAQIRGGVLVSNGTVAAPRAQRQTQGGYVTYAFE